MSCPICGGTRAWSIPFNRELCPVSGDVGGYSPETYGWWLCRICGNGYPSAQPNIELLKPIWAASRNDRQADPGEKKAKWDYRRQFSRVLAARSFRLFAPLNKPGRFLDIACGLGETVRIFADKGWDAEGLDADPTVEPLHKEIGIRTQIGQFETMNIGGHYQIIHIAHAIYFMTDPMGFLERVRTRLADNGHICIVLANFMASFDPSRPSYAHSFFPTGGSMRYALAKAGFETVLCRCIGGSIYIAAKRASRPELPAIHPFLTLLGHQTKAIRFAIIGRPWLALRNIVKALVKGRPI